MKGIRGAVLLLLILAGCGGGDPADGEAREIQVTPGVHRAEPPKANNPLADQQEAIEHARMVQDILDKDAEEKQKALSNLD